VNFCEQSDPCHNRQFRRRWIETKPPLTPADCDELAAHERLFGRDGTAAHYARKAAELPQTGADREDRRVPREVAR